MEKLNRFFKIQERGSNVRTEVIAGATTFATMAYILIVQALLMADAGMNPAGVILSTALMSGIITLFMALYAKLPFALAPAMGTNAIFAGLVASGGATFQEALGMVVIAGFAFLLLSIFRVREDMVKAMPKNLKVGVGAAIGMFLARLGFTNGGLVDATFTQLGDFSDPAVLLCLIGVAVAIVLSFIRVKINGRVYMVRGAMLLSILITTLIGLAMGVVTMPDSIFTGGLAPLGDVAFQVDLRGAFKLAAIPYIIIFFIGDFFSTLGTSLGLGAKAGMLDEDGNLPGVGRVFLVDAVGSFAGGFMGLTTITTYVESASGVEAGGRTGLASVVTSAFFFLSMLFAPLFLMIPNGATAPALIMIGISMMQVLRDVDFDATEWTPVALMLLLTALINDFAAGIAIGVASHCVIRIFQFAMTGEKDKLPHISTIVLAVLMFTKFFF